MKTRFGVKLRLPEGWADVTHDLPDGSPFTLAKPDGVGALQFTVATYRAGRKPDVSRDLLGEMLVEFGISRNLATATSQVEWTAGPCFGVSADFYSDDDWIRTWYVSDGRNVALVTYIALATEAVIAPEVQEADSIVRSIHW